MTAATTASRLVLEIEVPGFYVEGNEAELAEEWGGTLLDVVTDEWMRSDVGLTLVSIPGEKNLNSDFEVHAMDGRIIGARITKEGESRVRRCLHRGRTMSESAAQMEGDLGFRSFAERCEPPEHPAAQGRELTEYEKGYLNGLLSGTSTAPSGRPWAEAYEKKAQEYLESIGLPDWKVKVSRV